MLSLQGVLVDFGDTLAHVDREGGRRCIEEIASVLGEHGYEKTFDELRTILDDTYVNSTKGEMKDKYKLALVSNCAIGLSDVLSALGLTRFFECIILSYQVGVRKPDEHIYLEALRGL